ncbi:MAG: hypothetical protein AAGI03_02075 [Pseudomonadota bacterium]
MVNENNAGLEADVGITLNKITRQLARAEARALKAAKKIESDFTRSNRNVTRSFDRVATSTERIGRSGAANSLRQISLQLNQVAQSGAVTGNYLQASLIQLPDLLLPLGTFATLAGAAAGAVTPFILSLGRAGDAAEDLTGRLLDSNTGLSGVRGMLDELRQLQDQYSRAISESANTGSRAASIIVDASRREFEARRQLLEVELELQRTRGQTGRMEIARLEAAIEADVNKARRTLNNTSSPTRQETDYPFAGPSPEPDAVLLRSGLNVDEIRKRRLALQKLRAEQKLTTIGIEETARALETEFEAIDATEQRLELAETQASSRSGSRRRRTRDESNEAVQALRRVTSSQDFMASTAQAVQSSTNGLFSTIISGSQSAGDAVDNLARRLAAMTADRALQSLLSLGLDAASSAFGLPTGFANGYAWRNAGGLPVPAFSRGGYTGSGPMSAPAGIVHRGEYVVNARAVQRPGVRAALEALNAGLPGFMSGGAVGAPVPTNTALSPALSVHIHGGGSVPRIAQSNGGFRTDVFFADAFEAAASRGKLDRTMRTHWGMSRKPMGY